jgi:hypothetical protein
MKSNLTSFKTATTTVSLRTKPFDWPGRATPKASNAFINCTVDRYMVYVCAW